MSRSAPRMRCGWVFLALCAGAGFALPAQAGEMRGPSLRSTPRPPLHHARVEPPLDAGSSATASFGAAPWLGMLSFYRTTLSAVDGDRCSMAPTCSLYSKQALEKHGALLGVLLTADRLLHEADEIPSAPALEIRGNTYYRDPLEANTYWW